MTNVNWRRRSRPGQPVRLQKMLPTSTVAYDANATDDGENSGTLIYSLSAGGDNNHFNINAAKGEVTFKVSPNFEAPTDAAPTTSMTSPFMPMMARSTPPRRLTITVTNVNGGLPAERRSRCWVLSDHRRSDRVSYPQRGSPTMTPTRIVILFMSQLWRA